MGINRRIFNIKLASGLIGSLMLPSSALSLNRRKENPSKLGIVT